MHAVMQLAVISKGRYCCCVSKSEVVKLVIPNQLIAQQCSGANVVSALSCRLRVSAC